MKNIIIYITILSSFFAFGQTTENIKTVFLNKNITTHFLSKVFLDDIDLSTDYVVGLLKNRKIIAIKPKNEEEIELGVLSIIGQDYFKQYRLKYTNNIDFADKRVDINSNDKDYFLHPEYTMTNLDMFDYCKKIEKLEPQYNNTSTQSNRLRINLNNIIVKEDLIFVDFSIENNTNILYDINDVKYMIDDKNITKNNNSQRILVNEDFSYNEAESFKRNYRNIVCFKKMTFPDNKLFVIELAEKQISGRTARLYINYLDILNADKL